MNIYIKISFYNFAYFLFSAFLGILSEDSAIKILTSSFINKIKKEDKIKWKQKYNVSIQQSLHLSLLDNLGQPLHELIR